jgi:hypothetical protein
VLVGCAPMPASDVTITWLPFPTDDELRVELDTDHDGLMSLAELLGELAGELWLDGRDIED